MKKFWMVYVENGHSPQVKHESGDAAIAEAERLARLSPGKDVHILEGIITVKASLTVKWENIPNTVIDCSMQLAMYEKLNANPTVKDQPF